MSRVIYRTWFGNLLTIKREIVNRASVSSKAMKDTSTQKDNPYYGFKCLKYSVNESKGILELEILNKKKTAGGVSVKTKNGTAKAGEDYEKLERAIKFKKGQESGKIHIKIMDNDVWEPDEEFFVELYDYKTGYKLVGRDVTCTIVIIDDDNPGVLSFA